MATSSSSRTGQRENLKLAKNCANHQSLPRAEKAIDRSISSHLPREGGRKMQCRHGRM